MRFRIWGIRPYNMNPLCFDFSFAYWAMVMFMF